MRGKKERQLDYQISLRLRREDYDQLRDFAVRRGLRVPQLLRIAALEKALREGV